MSTVNPFVRFANERNLSFIFAIEALSKLKAEGKTSESEDRAIEFCVSTGYMEETGKLTREYYNLKHILNKKLK